MITDPQAIATFNYINHKGVYHVYRVEPTGKLIRGPNKWHPKATWLIEAYVVERDGVKSNEFGQGYRTFDPAKIRDWTTEVEPDPVRRAAYLLIYRMVKDAATIKVSDIFGYLNELQKALDSTR